MAKSFDLTDPKQAKEYLETAWPGVDAVEFYNGVRVKLDACSDRQLIEIALQFWEMQQLRDLPCEGGLH